MSNAQVETAQDRGGTSHQSNTVVVWGSKWGGRKTTNRSQRGKRGPVGNRHGSYSIRSVVLFLIIILTSLTGTNLSLATTTGSKLAKDQSAESACHPV